MTFTRTIKRTAIAAVVAAALVIGAPASPASADDEQLGTCGHGNIAGQSPPGGHCTPDNCSGVFTGPHDAPPAVNNFFLCVKI